MDAGRLEADELLAKVEAEVEDVYREALEDMRARQAKEMAAYEKALKKKREDLKAGRITQKDLDEWLRREQASAEWTQSMIDSLAADLTSADKIAASVVNGRTPDAYAGSFNFGTYQVEHDGSVDTAFTLYDRDTVERLLAEHPDLLPQVAVDEKKDLRWNRQHVTSSVLQSILQGEPIDAAAKRLESAVGMSRRAAIRSARTAMTGAENAGRVDSYKRAEGMGIEVRKKWLATLDMRTRDSHARLDGEVVDVDKKFSNGLAYPGDPSGEPGEVYNCRCTLVADVSGVDQSDAKRDSRLGKMSYAEWKKGR